MSAAASSAVSSAAHSELCLALASATDEVTPGGPPAPALERGDSAIAAFRWLRELGRSATLGSDAPTRAVAEQAVRDAELGYEAARSALRA
jgi:hypothetical protein